MQVEPAWLPYTVEPFKSSPYQILSFSFVIRYFGLPKSVRISFGDEEVYPGSEYRPPESTVTNLGEGYMIRFFASVMIMAREVPLALHPQFEPAFPTHET